MPSLMMCFTPPRRQLALPDAKSRREHSRGTVSPKPVRRWRPRRFCPECRKRPRAAWRTLPKDCLGIHSSWPGYERWFLAGFNPFKLDAPKGGRKLLTSGPRPGPQRGACPACGAGSPLPPAPRGPLRAQPGVKNLASTPGRARPPSPPTPERDPLFFGGGVSSKIRVAEFLQTYHQ